MRLFEESGRCLRCGSGLQPGHRVVDQVLCRLCRMAMRGGAIAEFEPGAIESRRDHVIRQRLRRTRGKDRRWIFEPRHA